VFETLVSMADDYSLKPLLATAWEFVEPGTWRFHLRKNVKFHDCQPLDAKAVVYSAKLWAQRPDNQLSLGPDSAVAVDDTTVDIKPTVTNRRLAEQLVHPLYGIQAPGTSAGDGQAPATTPTGTGPFRFVSYTQGQSLAVARFDGHWGPKPVTGKITFRFLPDDAARLLALKAGQIDAMYDVPRAQVSDLKKDRTLRIVTSGVGSYDAILLNLHGQPPYDKLGDLAVRQAVAYGIDRKTVVDNIWKGNAEVMQTFIPAPALGSYASLVQGHPYDPGKARALLEADGWKLDPDGYRSRGGTKLELSLWVTQPDLQAPLPDLVQAELKDVGMKVSVNAPGDPSVYFDRLSASAGDMFAEVGDQNDANPVFLGAPFTAAPGGFSDYAKSFGVGSPYDQLFEQAIAAPTTDEARRLAGQAMHLALDQTVAAAPIAGIYRIWGLRSNVQGFAPRASEVQQTWDSVWATAAN
jgi:peptide/nickel transport system substrate-binding protein